MWTLDERNKQSDPCDLKPAVKQSPWIIYKESASCTVSSNMYGKTTCTVFLDALELGRLTHPCGDGNGHTITPGTRKYLMREIRRVKSNES